MEWVTLLVVGLVVLAIIGLGFWLVPVLQKNKLVSAEGAKATQQMLNLLALVMQSFKIDNANVKDQIELIINVSKTVVGYVEQVMTNSSPGTKKAYAVSAVLEILKQSNVEVTEEIKKLIEIGIESAVSALPPTNK